MSDYTPRKLFVNMAVRDVPASRDFFGKLGFVYDERFSDQNAACMILSAEAFVMLLHEPYFKTFTTREICDTRTHTEALYALSCESKGEVDEMVRNAIAAGGKEATNPIDQGFMYVRTFYDLDGHHWEVLWMDASAMQGAPNEAVSAA